MPAADVNQCFSSGQIGRCFYIEIGRHEQLGGNGKGPALTGENRNSGPDQNTYATRA